MNAPVLLALDPSITAFGWVVVSLESDPVLVGAGVIETKPAPKKKRGSVAEDDARRVRFIRRELARVFDHYSPAVVAIEVPFGSQTAKAAKALGAAQALAACVVDERLAAQAIYITVHEAGDAIGVARTQRVAKGEPKKDSSERAASSKVRKGAIARAVVERFGLAPWARALFGWRGDRAVDRHELLEKRWEGAHDAAAVALAACERPEVAALRRMAACA